MSNTIKRLTGKKLLLLGTNTGTSDMVNYARSQGAYVIVTDNLPPEKSAAKLIADEAWSVSTADVDTLEKLAFANKVNGIFAGVSEFNLEKALTLCERLGLPFYCTREQWELCSNKRRFKELCRANGVPVTREYLFDSNYKGEHLGEIQYPVIVKPVDNNAGTGISICRSDAELFKAYSKAVSHSKTHSTTVEEYIDGLEFVTAYTIKDGAFSLSFMLDKYNNPEPTETMPLPQLNILPSQYLDKYLSEFNPKVIKMFQSIGLSNGFIFLQGMVKNDRFYFFETNFRLDGALWYRFAHRINGINQLEMLVNHALTGKMAGYDLSLDSPRFNKCCCIFALVSGGGLVGKIIGLEEIRRKKGLIAIDKLYDVGDFIEKSGTLRQIHLQFLLIEDTLEEIKNSIREIQDTVKVLDDKGQDILLPPFDINRIKIASG